MIQLLLAEGNREITLVVVVCFVLLVLDYGMWVWYEMLNCSITIGPRLWFVPSYINITLAFGGLFVIAKIYYGQVAPVVSSEYQGIMQMVLYLVANCCFYTIGYELTRLKR